MLRRKYRRDRRPGLPLENRAVLYSRYLLETARKQMRLFRMYLQYQRLHRGVVADTSNAAGADIAMQPVRVDELDRLERFTATTAAKATAHKAKQKAARARLPVSPWRPSEPAPSW